MCCFSRPVQHVANTRIFARFASHDTQFLAYEMRYAASGDLAMILPLPIETPASETSVRFINLEKYPTFFGDLDIPFTRRQYDSRGGFDSRRAVGNAPLPVVSVGRFSASFVPTLNDFGRLDAQFVLPKGVWDKVRAYRDFGFAVFKLKAAENQLQMLTHPMAFAFRSRFNDRLFLPTLHIHDNQVHPAEVFDHALFVQDARLDSAQPPSQFRSSGQAAAHFVDARAAQNMVDAALPCFKREIKGSHANRDIYIPLT